MTLAEVSWSSCIPHPLVATSLTDLREFGCCLLPLLQGQSGFYFSIQFSENMNEILIQHLHLL